MLVVTTVNIFLIDSEMACKVMRTIGLYSITTLVFFIPRLWLEVMNYDSEASMIASFLLVYLSGAVYCAIFFCEKSSMRLFEASFKAGRGESMSVVTSSIEDDLASLRSGFDDDGGEDGNSCGFGTADGDNSPYGGSGNGFGNGSIEDNDPPTPRRVKYFGGGTGNGAYTPRFYTGSSKTPRVNTVSDAGKTVGFDKDSGSSKTPRFNTDSKTPRLNIADNDAGKTVRFNKDNGGGKTPGLAKDSSGNNKTPRFTDSGGGGGKTPRFDNGGGNSVKRRQLPPSGPSKVMLYSWENDEINDYRAVISGLEERRHSASLSEAVKAGGTNGLLGIAARGEVLAGNSRANRASGEGITESLLSPILRPSSICSSDGDNNSCSRESA